MSSEVRPTPSKLPPYGDYRKPSTAWFIVAIACMANFLDLFQATMVNFGLREISASLGLTILEINWVIVAYTVTFATFLLIAGQLADRFGLRLTFLIGTGLLTVSNVLCAWTPDKHGLIAGRSFAGIGAAFTCATGISVIGHTFPPGKSRNIGLMLYVTMAPVGTILGVICGALLTVSPVGWRSLFWVSFIFAALTSVIGFLFVPVFEIPPGKKSVPLDYLGAAVFTAGIAMFVYGLNDSENAGWKSPQIIITVILGTILVVAFPIIQYKEAHPVAPKYFLFNPRICLALGCFIVFGGGYTTWFYLATQMFINSFKYTPVNSALYLLPGAGAAFIAGGLGNFLMTLCHERWIIIGVHIFLIGSLIPWGLASADQPIWYTIVFALMYLGGSPPGAVAAQAIVLRKTKAEDHGVAAAFLNIAYQAGSSLLLAVTNAVIGSQIKKGDTEENLLRGYKAAMWTLLGVTVAGLVVFVALYHEKDEDAPHEPVDGSGSGGESGIGDVEGIGGGEHAPGQFDDAAERGAKSEGGFSGQDSPVEREKEREKTL